MHYQFQWINNADENRNAQTDVSAHQNDDDNSFKRK